MKLQLRNNISNKKKLKDKEVEKIVGGKVDVAICYKWTDAGPCFSNDFGSYDSCHSCSRNPRNMDYSPLTGTYEKRK